MVIAVVNNGNCSPQNTRQNTSSCEKKEKIISIPKGRINNHIQQRMHKMVIGQNKI